MDEWRMKEWKSKRIEWELKGIKEWKSGRAKEWNNWRIKTWKNERMKKLQNDRMKEWKKRMKQLTLWLPWVTKREFLISLFIQYHADKWWE